MAEVSILDYGIGNTGSIINMFRKLRVDAEVVSTQSALAPRNGWCCPGVGAFDACMQALQRFGLQAAVLDFAATRAAAAGDLRRECRC